MAGSLGICSALNPVYSLTSVSQNPFSSWLHPDSWGRLDNITIFYACQTFQIYLNLLASSRYSCRLSKCTLSFHLKPPKYSIISDWLNLVLNAENISKLFRPVAHCPGSRKDVIAVLCTLQQVRQCHVPFCGCKWKLFRILRLGP